MTHPVTAADGLAPPATEPDHRDVDHDMAAMLPGSKIWAQADEDGEGWAVFVDRVMVAAYTEGEAYRNREHAEAYRDQLIDQRDQAAAADRRARLVAGIRELADFLEQHPDVPEPCVSGHCWAFDLDGEGFRHAVEAMRARGGTVAETTCSGKDALVIKLDFGATRLQYEVYAEKVCDMQETTVMRPVIPAWARNDDQIAEAA